MSEVRYVLHPGYVTSRNDWQRHFISAPKLASLYAVDLRKCVIVEYHMVGLLPPGFIDRPTDVHLWPRSDGDYAIPIP